MTDFLDRELTTVALCWRVARRDGVTLGFTGHDRDLAVGGIVYRAAPGMLPSAITRSDGLDVDSMDVAGALSDAAIGARDLEAGRYDGAAVSLFAVDWEAPEGETLPLARGELGDVETGEGGFTAELRGPTALLERAVVEETSPECRAALGDRRCRVDMAGRTRIAVVASVEDESVTFEAAIGAAGDYDFGRLRWLTGLNSGLGGGIANSTATGVMLREASAFSVAAGDRAELAEGCDKRLETCVARFANAANFRGEPYLPGNDLLTRYPGG